MDSRIEAFLEWFINDKLGKLSVTKILIFFCNYIFLRQINNLLTFFKDDEFNTTITTLIKMKSQADVTLSEDFERNWNEIQSREYLFDRNLREIKLFEECDKQKMVEFVTAVISKSNEKRRKLSVQVVGSSEMGKNKIVLVVQFHEIFVDYIKEYFLRLNLLFLGEETLEDQPDDAIFDITYDNEVGSDENLLLILKITNPV